MVDITGVELKNEEMIKLPVQVMASTNADWHNTLAEAHDKLERLDAEGVSLQMSNGRYIRPLAVVRVERTGKEQRDTDFIHAEDVREYLVQSLGVPSDAVAVKSSEMDELRGKDLLSEFLASALDHHQSCPDGGLGLPLCLRPGHAGQHPGAAGAHPAGRTGNAATPRAANGRGSPRPVLRLLLQCRRWCSCEPGGRTGWSKRD